MLVLLEHFEWIVENAAHRKEHIRLLIFGASNVVYIVDMTLDAPKISCQIHKKVQVFPFHLTSMVM